MHTTYLLWSFENENKMKSYHWHEVLQHSLEKPFSILINWQISSSKYRSADYLWLLKNRSFGIHIYEALCYICTKTVFHLFFSMYTLNLCPCSFFWCGVLNTVLFTNMEWNRQWPNFSVKWTFAVKIQVMFSYKILNIKF